MWPGVFLHARIDACGRPPDGGAAAPAMDARLPSDRSSHAPKRPDKPPILPICKASTAYSRSGGGLVENPSQADIAPFPDRRLRPSSRLSLAVVSWTELSRGRRGGACSGRNERAKSIV